MPKIRILKDEEIDHPIETCIPDLVELLQDIYEKQENLYRVPYEEVNTLTTELDNYPDDDIALFNEKYSKVQSQNNRITVILIELRQELKEWKSLKNRLKILYRKARNLLLVERPEIKALRNKELQEAAIQNKITNLVDIVEGVDNIIEGIEEDISIVKIKKDNLDNANINLSRQQKVVEDIMALNGIVGVRGVKVKLRVNN